jgi:hypothetical protein|tara:strand:- start:697 stop:1443 length:747 start_codon:yes stop_codon:yes gene_type:complete
MSLTLERLYHPDGKHLGALVAGLSGSGKTTAIISTLQQALKMKTFGEYHRFIVIDPKTQYGDYDKLAEPIYDMDKVMKSIRKNRITVFYPSIDYLQDQVEFLIDYMFSLADAEPKTSFTFVLDEASILITPTKIPQQIKRLAVQGRAKKIKPVFISQRPIVNRWTDANLSTLLLFNTLPVDYDTLSKRWGVDFHKIGENVREQEYSYLWFDMEKATFKQMKPVELPKPLRKKKKKPISRKITDFFRLS